MALKPLVSDNGNRLAKAVDPIRRPVRLVEVVVAVLASWGVVISDSLEQHLTLGAIGLFVILGGELAQTLTTPTAAPAIDDEHSDMDMIYEVDDEI